MRGVCVREEGGESKDEINRNPPPDPFTTLMWRWSMLMLR